MNKFRDDRRSLFVWILSRQAVISVLLALAAGFGFDWISALGLALGGMIGMLLTIYFATRAFSVDAGDDPQAAASALYRAEAMKLVMAILLFALAARFLADIFLQLVLGYAVTVIPFWLALRWFKPET